MHRCTQDVFKWLNAVCTFLWYVQLATISRLVGTGDKARIGAYIVLSTAVSLACGLAMMALMETGEAAQDPAIEKASAWLREAQITDARGDWAAVKPDVTPGGWAFQYHNDFYPDVDDTAVVAMALDRAGSDKNKDALKRAADWIVGSRTCWIA